MAASLAHRERVLQHLESTAMPTPRKAKKNRQHYEPPKVGDYVARAHQPFADFRYDAYVVLKTDVLSETRISACETLEGAKLLAKLLNDVRDLAICWRDITKEPLHKGGSAEDWARIKIASAVCRALGINHMHDFGASAMDMPVFGKRDEGEDRQ